jgi:hypothetical protein
MLDNDTPPDDWHDLLKDCYDPKLKTRFKAIKRDDDS